MYMIGDDKIAKQNYSVARDVTYNREDSRFFSPILFFGLQQRNTPPVLSVGKIKSFSKNKTAELGARQKSVGMKNNLQI